MNSPGFNLSSFLKDRFAGTIESDFPLKRITSWKIGGPADWRLVPDDEHSLIEALKIIKDNQVPYLVLGGGTNILFKDSGFRGVVIQLGNGFRNMDVSNHVIRVSAAAQLNAVTEFSFKSELSGLEPLVGIPGTVGGAAFLNAGAYGHNILDFVTELKGYNADGEMFSLIDVASLYRSGCIEYGAVITELKIKLQDADHESIREKANHHLQYRKKTQPWGEASAGCTFKNPTA